MILHTDGYQDFTKNKSHASDGQVGRYIFSLIKNTLALHDVLTCCVASVSHSYCLVRILRRQDQVKCGIGQ